MQTDLYAYVRAQRHLPPGLRLGGMRGDYGPLTASLLLGVHFLRASEIGGPRAASPSTVGVAWIGGGDDGRPPGCDPAALRRDSAARASNFHGCLLVPHQAAPVAMAEDGSPTRAASGTLGDGCLNGYQRAAALDVLAASSDSSGLAARLDEPSFIDSPLPACLNRTPRKSCDAAPRGTSHRR